MTYLGIPVDMDSMKNMEMDIENVRDKSWEWLIKIFARNALKYALRWRMASLEPGSFEYITHDEFRNEAATVGGTSSVSGETSPLMAIR
eukprot:Skav233646  [mRNA]  locus=scaffold2779:715999:720419:- [translate_table: standard]